MEQTIAFPEAPWVLMILIGVGIFMALVVSLVLILVFCKLRPQASADAVNAAVTSEEKP